MVFSTSVFYECPSMCIQGDVEANKNVAPVYMCGRNVIFYALQRKNVCFLIKLIINVRTNVMTDIHNTKLIQPIK